MLILACQTCVILDFPHNKQLQIHKTPRMDGLTVERVSVFFFREIKPLYLCESCQIEGKHPNSCPHMSRRSCSIRLIRLIRIINTPTIGEEFFKKVSDDYGAIK